MPLSTHLVYYENAVGRVSEHANGYAIVQYKPGKRLLGDFQALLTHLGHLLQRRSWHKVLTDQRAMTPFTDEERRWIREQWLTTQTERHQDVMVAMLLPEDVFARLATNLVMHEAQEGILHYQIFQDEVSAAAWLRQAP
ncbi:hypothetical protein [Hymenobacter cavernae]|uniref:STAS/SEC14 domain-containing protein n=1 Tax=Hymenobacter cavernae TaxID=2044852 RepID=A0ABQ1UN43_9BACT|nr:hypothetical protein [Hymenobacter cavernae]GGF22065.1 hypothetical protein GCM10011383_37130 [Hymenobacter cavernae]